MGGPPGRKIAGYEIEAELARGGMGVIYRAEQPALGRRVVLKSLRRGLDDDPREEERFAREASAVARLHHPNVVGVYDCFRWRGRLFIAQEYVEGTDLASALLRTGPLDSRTAALVALEIARGLEEIHGRGLVHRDLKPANVLLGRAGEVKIADFGVALDARGASLTRTGTSLGTPAYMSPEQLQGARVDFRSDLFSFGVLFYEILSGALPFGEPSASSEPLLERVVAQRRRALRLAAPGTPRGLARLVQRCLRATPARRAASPGEIRRRLERWLGAPSPADARRELADRLIARQAFPAAPDATVPAAARDVPTKPPGRLVRRAAGSVAAALALATLVGLGWGAVAIVGDSVAAIAAIERRGELPPQEPPGDGDRSEAASALHRSPAW